MRYLIKQAGCGSERVGVLSGFARTPGCSIETPTAALFTKGGSVAHLTADVLSKVFSNPQLLWVPLASTIQMETGAKAQGEGIAKFSGLSEHVACCSFNDTNETTPQGHFEKESIPLWSRSGKKMMNAERYMTVMESFKPDIVLAIADSRTSLNEGRKRISKSVDRTCSMLDLCMKKYKGSTELQDSGFIGVIVGASRPKDCEECLKRVLLHKDSLKGVSLSGLSDGSGESIKVNVEQLEPILKKVSGAIPKDLFRIIEGCWNPAVIVAAIEHGWDVFDGSYPAKLTNLGQALKLKLDISTDDSELCILDLNDKRYNEDFGPILSGCDCLACKKHTRAYIHHLLNTREMLSTVLLSIHNLHHFDQMFRQVRHHISANTFQIFKKHISEQYELYLSTQPTTVEESSSDETKGDSEQSMTIPCSPSSKKKRVSNGSLQCDINVCDKA